MELEIEKHWDAIAKRSWKTNPRQRWFHDSILHPCIKELLTSHACRSFLDFGCGTGDLLAKLEGSHLCAGYEPSTEMAIRADSNTGRTTTIFTDREDIPRCKYEAIVLNMVLPVVSELSTVLSEVIEHVAPQGWVLASISHPIIALTSRYHRTTERKWVEPLATDESADEQLLYFKEPTQRIHWDNDSRHSSLYYHRSLETYVDSFSRAGLRVVTLREPRPTVAEPCPDLFDLFGRLPAFLVFGLQAQASK